LVDRDNSYPSKRNTGAVRESTTEEPGMLLSLRLKRSTFCRKKVDRAPRLPASFRVVSHRPCVFT
jgi:hypothetical protein